MANWLKILLVALLCALLYVGNFGRNYFLTRCLFIEILHISSIYTLYRDCTGLYTYLLCIVADGIAHGHLWPLVLPPDFCRCFYETAYTVITREVGGGGWYKLFFKSFILEHYRYTYYRKYTLMFITYSRLWRLFHANMPHAMHVSCYIPLLYIQDLNVPLWQ
jgi:hypothetical protein